MQSMPVQQPMKTMSQIGISVEPLHVIQHQIPAETTQVRFYFVVVHSRLGIGNC